MKKDPIADNGIETVDLIASGYEWICPRCSKYNCIIEASEVVTCTGCKTSYSTGSLNHAIA